MILSTAKRAGLILGIGLLALLVLGGAFFVLTRINRPDPLPAQVARTDEKASRAAADTVERQTEAAQRDANINIDLVTKEVRDAFDAIPAVPVTAEPRALPPAPVDRVRDRLNESITRANRAAGAAGKAD